ncbi:MAG: hypothetical protein QGI83_05120 [Candidatus Latescibacteria bacterium]|jgi:hypothetical protein|nr:hypothetical protein [Candidatus Latescibacterota bacterium]
MSRRFGTTAKGLAAVVVVLTGMAFLSACGEMDRSPLGSTSDGTSGLTDAPPPPVSGTFSIGFSPQPRTQGALTKPGKLKKKWTVGLVTPRRGGKLKLDFSIDKEDLDNWVQVEEVEFKVQKKSCSKFVIVSMVATSGSDLGDIMVDFGPAGLQFRPEAELKIEIRGYLDKDEVEDLVAYHVEHDGTVTVIPVKVTGSKDKWKLTIKVPGFSYYDVAGDDECDEDIP